MVSATVTAPGALLRANLSRLAREREYVHYNADAGTAVRPMHEGTPEGLLTEITSMWAGGWRFQFTRDGKVVVRATARDPERACGYSEQEVARFPLDTDELAALCAALVAAADAEDRPEARREIMRRFPQYTGRILPPMDTEGTGWTEEEAREYRRRRDLDMVFSYRFSVLTALASVLTTEPRPDA